MRLRSTLLAVATMILASACIFGSSAKPPASTSAPIPTATPFANVPPPVIVTPGPAAAAPGATPTGTQSETVYTVVAGDSISVLADRFDVPSAAIRALNNLTSDALSIGQKVKIPAKSTVNPGTSSTPPPLPSTGVSTYTVKAGDTAFGIALQFDTTVEKLEAANNVKSGGLTNLQLGQVLKLPPPGSR